MPKSIGNVQFGSPEAVIAESIIDRDIGRAVFSTEARFGELLAQKPTEEAMESRLTRLVGRKILFMGGLSPLAIGSEMVVVGDFATGEVRKYAYRSTDPEGDAAIERDDQRLCREYLGMAVVEKSFEVVSLYGPVLVERQPWLNVIPLQMAEPTDDLDRQADAIVIAAEKMLDEIGLFLDGSSLEVERDARRVVVLDTCLVDPSGIIENPNIARKVTPNIDNGHRSHKRSWQGLDIGPGGSSELAA